ncbi:hypothetical protein L596_019179 [Steinernema carpocapsae]|uniref:Uncharacterized protein n=1 Tax=Steinernema carpocapsae TaxID=34508 RepID=A0A4U5N6Z0_STECR|nr:hypothetical protein L596_019179 [Steinernema carpocapsae]
MFVFCGSLTCKTSSRLLLTVFLLALPFLFTRDCKDRFPLITFHPFCCALQSPSIPAHSSSSTQYCHTP